MITCFLNGERSKDGVFTTARKHWKHLRSIAKLDLHTVAMAQNDTPRQKELICIMIDKVNGPVSSDWTGEDWTDNREAAKEYVMEYGKKIKT